MFKKKHVPYKSIFILLLLLSLRITSLEKKSCTLHSLGAFTKLDILPREIKNYILDLLFEPQEQHPQNLSELSNPEIRSRILHLAKINHRILKNSALSIRRSMNTCLTRQNDQANTYTEYIIKKFAQMYTNNNTTQAAIALATQSTGLWLLGNYSLETEKWVRKSFSNASRKGKVTKLNFIINYFPHLARSSNWPHLPPLISATFNNRYHAVEFLINAGFNIDQVDKKGSSSLFYAITTPDRISILKLLLSKNAQQKDSNGLTAIMAAKQFGNYVALDILLRAYFHDLFFLAFRTE